MTFVRRIAVIGAGAAGLAAAHLLSKKHEVTLFESSDSLGGHAHAETLRDEKGAEFQVDTAFLIFNEGTYPTFLQFLDSLGVRGESHPAEMSSCFSDSQRDLHYTLGAGLTPFLAKPGNLLRPELWLILKDLLAFRKRAVADLTSGQNLAGVTAGEYLSCYSHVFVESFIWPLTAAIWSLPATQMSEYPILSLLQYFDNHQLLRGRSPKLWKTFRGSSAVYVRAFARSFRGEIRLRTPIFRVAREPGAVRLQTQGGIESFDDVVLATHADTSLKLLQQPTADESRLLGAWSYQNNTVTLHHDTRLLHEDPRLWGSWNMRRKPSGYEISYYLNRLQDLSTKKPVILTLGEASIETSAIVKRFQYRHPIFNEASVATQPELAALNGVDHIFYCGSYFGFGFHEDAVKSAAEVAAKFNLSFKG